MDDTAFDREIRIKLKEEVDEAVTANDSTALMEELADIYEVIDSLGSVHGITEDEIILAQTRKRESRGGFMGRKFVEVAEHPIGSFGEKYCLADPEKYPEIMAK